MTLSVLGSVGLVAWSFPILVTGYVPLVIALMSIRLFCDSRLELTIHCLVITLFQPVNRDTKRLDSLQRSHVYSSLSEHVSFMSTRFGCSRADSSSLAVCRLYTPFRSLLASRRVLGRRLMILDVRFRVDGIDCINLADD